MNKQEIKFAADTAHIKGFYAPWTKGSCHAYAAADTFAAAKKGFARKRTSQMFKMPNSGIAGTKKCLGCGELLKDLPNYGKVGAGQTGAAPKPDTHSTWHYSPKTKKVYGGMHYVCSWSDLFGRIAQLRSY